MLHSMLLCLAAGAAPAPGGSVQPVLSLVDSTLEQASTGGAFDLALGHAVDVVVAGEPGAAVLIAASVTPPPDPPPVIGGAPLGVDPLGHFLLVNGLADPAAKIGPGGFYTLSVVVPTGLPPGSAIYIQAAALTLPALELKLTPGLVLTVVDARIFDFEGGFDGFTTDFCDYTLVTLPTVDPEEELTVLPPPLDTTEPALRVSANNPSDDLFRFIKHRLDGLAPSTPRAFRIEVRFASDAPAGKVGVGGAPGESVFMKAGGAGTEPLPVPLPSDPQYIGLNLDKGQQAEGGTQLVVIGNVATPPETTWDLLEHRMTEPLVATTDAAGGLWMCVGTDSGYESVTELYYDRIVVKLLD
jgi:hypothetical protein